VPLMALILRKSILSAPAAPSFTWPTDASTGATGTLTTVGRTGFGQSVNSPDGNRTITNIHYTDGIVVGPYAPNMTFRNCKITGGDFYGVEADNSNGLTMDYCTVIGQQTANYNYAINAGANCVITNCNVSVYEHAIGPGIGASIIRGNYLHHAFVGAPALDRHVGGVSIKGGTGWVSTLVENNVIYAQDTSAVFIKNDFGPVANVTVRNNKMLNEPGFPAVGFQIQANSSGPSGLGKVTGTVIIDNFMEKGFYGHFGIEAPATFSCVVTNNFSYTLNRVVGRDE
jgi:hypothetical protein